MDDKSLIRHYENEIDGLKHMVSDLMGRLQSGGGGGGDGIAPYIETTVRKLINSMEKYMEKTRSTVDESKQSGNVVDELRMHELEVRLGLIGGVIAKCIV
jgi:hypothetical protein